MRKNFADFGIDVPHSASGEFYTTCPECSKTRKKQKNKCLSVNVDKGVWNCHHCTWAGTLKEGARSSNRLHWERPQYRKPEPLPAVPLKDNAHKWFQGRGITDSVLLRNKITEKTIYMPQVEREVNAIAFPYFRNGEMVNAKYRDGQKNFRMEAGAECVLYGLDDIKYGAGVGENRPVVIVEGEIDKLSVEVAGVMNCVSVPHGAPSEKSKDYSSKFQFLESDEELISGVKEWIIAVDNDPAGQRLEQELVRRLGHEKCKRVNWPSECKDANDVLIKHGPGMLALCIQKAQAYPLNGVFTVAELSSRIDYLYEHGWQRGVSTGWPDLDSYYTVRPGEVTVVTGIPNSGKSNWLDCLVVNLGKLHGWRTAIFSPENQPVEDHMARMLEKYAGVPFHNGPSMRMDAESLEISKAWLNEFMFWILPDDDTEWTIDAILDRARALVLRKGITGLVIDPWNEIETAIPDGMSETNYISLALKRIRQFARKHQIHIWIVAHPQKMYKDKDGDYSVPTMYDISGSAHWRNKADNGIAVWRNFTGAVNEVLIYIQKIRFKQVGRVGSVEMIYEHATGTYRQKADYEYGRDA